MALKDEQPTFTLTSECPVICVDGTLLGCSYVGQTCVPRAAIERDDLFNLIKESQDQMEKEENEISGFRRLLQRRASTGVKPTSQERRLAYKEERRKKSRSWGPGSDSGVKRGLDRLYKDLIIVQYEPKGREELENNKSAKAETLKKMKIAIEKSVEWIRRVKEDYITMEKFNDVTELNVLLNVLLKCKTPSLIETEVNRSGEILVTYQFLYGFRNDFMMIKIDSKYSLLMRTF